MNKQCLILCALSFGLIVSSNRATIAHPISLTSIQVDRQLLSKSQSDNTYLIQPGRVGSITRATSKQDLIRLFGATNIKDFTAHGAEGQGNFPATRVTIDRKPSIGILWQITNSSR